MDLQALKNEINGDPAGIGYAALLPDAPGAVCERMNAKTHTMHKSKMMSFRGLYSIYGVGPVMAPAVLAKIRAGAGSNQVLFDIKEMIYSDQGLDFGDGSTLAVITQLTPSVFTPEEADALRAISVQAASRAEVLFGASTVVTIDNLREAGVI